MTDGSGPITVAIAGCGAVAELYYAPALAELEAEGRLRLVGAYDPDTAQAARVLAGRGAPARSFDELLETRAEFVIVASPPARHVGQVVQALEAGADVFCEKPLAISSAEARQMADAAERAGRSLSVGMVRRSFASTETIREIIRSGALGDLRSVSCFEGGPFSWPVRSPSYFTREVSGGGVLQDIGTHCVDLLLWWLGPPSSASYEDDAMGGVEANCRLSLDYGEFSAEVRLSRDWKQPNLYEFVGTNGRLRWETNDAGSFEIEFTAPGTSVAAQARRPGGETETFAGGFRRQLERALDQRRGGGPPIASAASVLDVVELIERCYTERKPMAIPWLVPATRSPVAGSVAVVGANGFVGNRTVEMLQFDPELTVRPIVRRASALALPMRFDLDCRVADALDAAALTEALRGCEVAVHCIAGPPGTIVGAIDPLYDAATAAGVRRIVYLSSAAVHGQDVAHGTTEETPLSDRQPVAYNNAKVRAERRLLERRAGGPVEVVILRPGIVYGPRSYWIGGLADELIRREAVLIDGGTGICNAVYVDNLVNAVALAAHAKLGENPTYFVTDAEDVTWRDMFEPVAGALGIRLEDMPEPIMESGGPSLSQISKRIMRRYLPRPLIAGLRAAAESMGRRPIGPTQGGPPIATLEKVMLHRNRTKLSSAKAARELGYRASVSFEEGMARSLDWLEFAGYRLVSGR